MKFCVLFLFIINLSCCVEINLSEPFDAVIGLYHGLVARDYKMLKIYMTDSSYKKLGNNFSFCYNFPKNVQVNLIQDSFIDNYTHSVFYSEKSNNITTYARMTVRYSNNRWKADVFTRKQITR